jgi:hypothetical protein
MVLTNWQMTQGLKLIIVLSAMLALPDLEVYL